MSGENRFYEAFCDGGRKPIAVELDSPEGPDTEKFMAGAAALRDGGADLITVADCPVARPRMDSSLAACKIRRELGMDAMPHMTCRDRNRNASQALFLGLYAEGIRNLMLVMGDPVPKEERQAVKGVYNFNSVGFIAFAERFGRERLPEPFHIYGALNLNVRNFDLELARAKTKEAAGAQGFFTQPVLTEQALENLKLARRELKGRLAGGIIPVVSQRNGLFMDQNIPGISVDPRVIALYEGADKERGEELALEVSAAAAKAMDPYIDGYYLMTPFGRAGLMVRLMDRLRAEGLA